MEPYTQQRIHHAENMRYINEYMLSIMRKAKHIIRNRLRFVRTVLRRGAQPRTWPRGPLQAP